MSRVLVHFSCGIASAVALKIASQVYPQECHAIYCDLLASEHPDNIRFLRDVEKWTGQSITILGNKYGGDVDKCFRQRGFMASKRGAVCTAEMKQQVRKGYQLPDDLHVFGFTSDETHRVERIEKNNPEMDFEWLLVDRGITKSDCQRIVEAAGIEVPMMYKLGYHNNNCIGCVKGGAGYWNKIRRDFPEVFASRAAVEREVGYALNRVKGKRMYLDELPEDCGKFVPPADCGVLCEYDRREAIKKLSEECES